MGTKAYKIRLSKINIATYRDKEESIEELTSDRHFGDDRDQTLRKDGGRYIGETYTLSYCETKEWTKIDTVHPRPENDI